MEQTQIPADEPPTPHSGSCAWCGKRALQRIVVEPARWGKINGVRAMVRRPILAWVCPVHVQSLHYEGPDAA
jgi:hypothetical protein